MPLGRKSQLQIFDPAFSKFKMAMLAIPTADEIQKLAANGGHLSISLRIYELIRRAVLRFVRDEMIRKIVPVTNHFSRMTIDIDDISIALGEKHQVAGLTDIDVSFSISKENIICYIKDDDYIDEYDYDSESSSNTSIRNSNTSEASSFENEEEYSGFDTDDKENVQPKVALTIDGLPQCLEVHDIHNTENSASVSVFESSNLPADAETINFMTDHSADIRFGNETVRNAAAPRNQLTDLRSITFIHFLEILSCTMRDIGFCSPITLEAAISLHEYLEDQVIRSFQVTCPGCVSGEW